MKEAMRLWATQLTQKTGFAKIHVVALQAAVTMPRSDFITPVARDVHVKEVTVTGNEHVHLEGRDFFAINVGGSIRAISIHEQRRV